MKHLLLKYGLLFLLGFILLISTTSVYAGGGAVQPLNFSHGQQITGKSFSPEVAIKDPATGYTTYLTGKEFVIQAQGDLAGASCDTTQRTSDGQGKIKANCKADAYGKFGFDIIDLQGTGVTAHFDVYFTESSAGFPDQGSSGTYTVTIQPSSFTTTVNSTFKLEAILKKDGQTVSNYDEVNYFSWQVLQGSIVTLSATEAKNRALNFKTITAGKATLRVVVVMNNGAQVESGAIVVTTLLPPPPSPVLTSTPKTTPPPSTDLILSTNAPLLPASPTAYTNEQLTETVKDLQQQVADQQKELNILQRLVKNLSDFFSHLFG